jgi:hypothetical protein
VIFVARFYDTVNESELQWLEGVLKKGGIVYTLRMLEDDMTLLKEIMVAEEDLNEAEMLLYEKS